MATARRYIAFDLGASNGRGILGRFDGERLAIEAVHRSDNRPVELLGAATYQTGDYALARDAFGRMNELLGSDTVTMWVDRMALTIRKAMSMASEWFTPLFEAVQYAWERLSEAFGGNTGELLLRFTEVISVPMKPTMEGLGIAIKVVADVVAGLKNTWESMPEFVRMFAYELVKLTAEVWLLRKALISLGLAQVGLSFISAARGATGLLSVLKAGSTTSTSRRTATPTSRTARLA